MKERASWGTRTGFYMAVIASAFGLGNLWRFPYIVGKEGGGTFVLAYIALAFAIGLPVLIAELMMGKVTRLSAVLASTSKRFLGSSDFKFGPWIARFWLVVGLLLFSYYAVISGWVLYFLMQFSLAPFRLSPFETATLFDRLINGKTLQLGLVSVHVIIVSLLLSKGVREGIEKSIRVVMPVFFILMLFLIYKSLHLPGAQDALRFMFYPDFTKINKGLLIEAIGHVLFTLSVGVGSLVVLGSYLRKEVRVSRAGMIMTSMDIVLSLMAGLIIFPIAFSGSISVDAGQSLLFESMPLLFSRMGLGEYFGVIFFLCLYIAALVSGFALLEASVAHFQDKYKLERSRASKITGTLGFIIAAVPILLGLVYDEQRILLQYDFWIIKVLIPLAVLGLVFMVGYVMAPSTRSDYFISEDLPDTKVFYPIWIFVIRYAVPVLIISAFALSWFV